MRKTVLFLCLSLFMLMVTMTLFAQTGSETDEEHDYIPADSTASQPLSEQLQRDIKLAFEHFVKGDAAAQKLIYWDDFYLNGDDVTGDYELAVKDGTEEEYTRKIIIQISDFLQSANSAGDPYTEWSFEHNGYEIYAYCHDSFRDVDMWFNVPSETEPLQLMEISIADH